MSTLWDRFEQLSAPDQQELLIRCLRWFTARFGPDLRDEAVHQSRLYEGDWQSDAFAPEDFAHHGRGSSDYRYFTDDLSVFIPEEAMQRLVQMLAAEEEARIAAGQGVLLTDLIRHYEGLNGPWLAADAVVISRLPMRAWT